MTTTNSLSIKDAVNEDGTCKFCGMPTPFNTLSKFLLARGHANAAMRERCTCEKAVEFYKAFDTQQKEAQTLKEKKELEQIELEGRKNRIANYEKMLGRRFAGRTFENFDKKDNEAIFNICYEFAKNFKNNKGEGILFLGQVGTGKTHLAAAISNYIITQGTIPVKFGNVTSLLGEIKNTYEEDSKKAEYDVIRELSEVELLIIDDLGKEKSTDWSNNIIYRIVNNRYEGYRPLIVTTNYSMEELEKSVGDATTSRIIEMCRGVRINGKDRRKERLTR